jgi:anti-anti-sigma regulatory factor/PAS domain-containing protein
MPAADPHSAVEGPPGSLAAALAELYVGLAGAADERAIFTALLHAFERRAPAQVELGLLDRDDAGAPVTLTRVVRWTSHDEASADRSTHSHADPSAPTPLQIPTEPRDSHPSAIEPHTRGVLLREPGEPRPLADVPLAHRWLAAPGEPLHIADIADDPRLDPDERAALAPWRAVTVLPLHARGDDPWHGCITLRWSAPHPPAAEDPFVDRLLMQTVAAALAGRRSLRAHADALAESRTLHAVQARLHAADSLAGLLAVVAELADAAVSAWLLRAPADGPLELLATWGDRGLTLPDHLPLAAPTEPQFITDLTTAPLTDLTATPLTDLTTPLTDLTAAPLADLEPLRAVAVLPLRWRGRATAVIVLGRTTAHRFTAGERRLLTAAAREAAVVVDNRLLRLAAEQALREHQRQRATLAALLHHLPVGVVVHSVERGAPILVNHEAERLRRDLDTDALVYPGTDTPLPLDQWPIARAVREDQVVVGEVELRAHDGRRRTLESVAAPLHDDTGALTQVIAVTTEVTAWREAEAERARMHDLLVRAQAEALAERSTPLLPIADDILVMPIVGSIDDERGQQITETLVDLGGQRRVRVAIIDVTGAGELDLRAVHLLVGAARALRLRGAQPMLTGLSPALAADLAAQGIDLAGVAVHGSLQAGIARARELARRR